MPKISVIVPVYNEEKYLHRCLNSLIQQSLSDIEIICVDDGSTDNCGKLLDGYAEKESRIKVLHQINGGRANARNNALQTASGKYITFVNSDDFADRELLEKLYDASEKNNADIAAASIIRKRKHCEKYRMHYTEEKVYGTLEEKISACHVPKCCYVYGKLYKRDLLIGEKFDEGTCFEDILWLPGILKKASRLVTVPEVNYCNSSVMKQKPSVQKIADRARAKRFIIRFFETNGLPLSKQDRTINKKIVAAGKFPLLKVKEYNGRETFYLFGFIPVFSRPVLITDENTFVVWEPCSQSHSEVVPGYVKYLLDLGYSVSVIVRTMHYDAGLFSRFSHERLFLNKLTPGAARRYFKHADLSGLKGVLVTTAGKLCDNIHHEQAHSHFNHSLDKSKLFLVEHDAKPAVDAGTWSKDIITLRKLNYKSADSTSVNPHYFGEVNITPKNQDITNFIMVGKLGTGQSDNSVIIDAALQLLKDEITNFKITVVGKGDLDGLPPELAQRVDIKGRLPFDAMFAELEKADFMLTSYKGPQHDFYRTTGASGNFQLVFGFAKPCIIIDDFAGINGFNNDNAIVYKAPTEYADAMKKAISMSPAEYNVMQSKLAAHAAELRRSSLQNLSELIERRSALTK